MYLAMMMQMLVLQAPTLPHFATTKHPFAKTKPLPQAPFHHYQTTFGHYQAIFGNYQAPFYPLPSHDQAPFGPTKRLPSPLWPLPSHLWQLPRTL